MFGLSNILQVKKHKRFIITHFASILLFTLLYYITYNYFENSFHETNKEPQHIKKRENKNTMNFYDFFYFSLVTQTTVGYGDIVPTHPISRAINILQLLTIYGVIAISII